MYAIRSYYDPLLVTVVSLLIGFLFLRYIKAPHMVSNFMLGTTIAAGLATVITLFWKISIHLAAIGGLTAAICLLSIMYRINYSIPVSMLVLMSGLVGWARVELNAHTIGQVGAGWTLGVVSVILAFLI